MLVALKIGRSGNQLFQFAAIEKILKPNERAVYINFRHLTDLLPGLGDYGTFFELPTGWKRHTPLIEEILKIFARFRLIGGVYEESGGGTLVRKNGLLPVTMFWGGWCQNDQLLDVSAIAEVQVREAIPSLSSLRLEEGWNNGNVCFVHIRRGDYLTFPSETNSAALPAEWVFARMQDFRAEYPGLKFFVLSDDFIHATKIFSHVDDVSVIDCGAREAFQLMSECTHGILSPSSFSWWAAKLSHLRRGGSFVAPYLWAGWNSGGWIPNEFVKSDFLRYETVV